MPEIFRRQMPVWGRRNRNTGGLHRNYIALNVWWRAAASNLEQRPETAGNGRVWRVFDIFDAAGHRPAEGKFTTFFYWLTINFSFWVQLPQNKVGVPRPPDSDPLT